jgi:hypothetical protein
MKIAEATIRQVVREELKLVLEAYEPTEEEKEELRNSSYENVRNTDIYKKLNQPNPHADKLKSRIAAFKAAQKRKKKKV